MPRAPRWTEGLARVPGGAGRGSRELRAKAVGQTWEVRCVGRQKGTERGNVWEGEGRDQGQAVALWGQFQSPSLLPLLPSSPPSSLSLPSLSLPPPSLLSSFTRHCQRPKSIHQARGIKRKMSRSLASWCSQSGGQINIEQKVAQRIRCDSKAEKLGADSRGCN